MKLIDKIALLYCRDGEILTTRSRGKDAFYLPGGKREGAETDFETLVREIKEELGVDIVPGSAEAYGVFEAQAHGQSEGTLVRMSCYTAEFDGTPAPASEIEELAWFTTADMDRISPVDKLIFADLHEKGLLK